MSSYLWMNFNPRSLTGATFNVLISVESIVFQSTLPHGSDNNELKKATEAVVFQSTLPHGSDIRGGV